MSHDCDGTMDGGVLVEINAETSGRGVADVVVRYRNRMRLKCGLKLCMIGAD